MASKLSFLSVEPSSSDEMSLSSTTNPSNSPASIASTKSINEENDSLSLNILKELLAPPTTPPEIKLTLMDDLNAHCVFIPYHKIEDNVSNNINHVSNNINHVSNNINTNTTKRKSKDKSCFSLFKRCFFSFFEDLYCCFVSSREKGTSSYYDSYSFSDRYSVFIGEGYEDNIETRNLNPNSTPMCSQSETLHDFEDFYRNNPRRKNSCIYQRLQYQQPLPSKKNDDE
jgi:hypothetical protein